ncbi:hypothetical protein T439DRAFT_358116 [Meredithblackwellia eburnea MCA 4105]
MHKAAFLLAFTIAGMVGLLAPPALAASQARDPYDLTSWKSKVTYTNASAWFVEHPTTLTLCERISLRWTRPKGYEKPLHLFRSGSVASFARLGVGIENEQAGVVTFTPGYPLYAGANISIQIGANPAYEGWYRSPYFIVANSTTKKYDDYCHEIGQLKETSATRLRAEAL